jgi:shikimate kinase
VTLQEHLPERYECQVTARSLPHDSTLLFLIGPAGVGKSTCGELLASSLGFNFVDLDGEFQARVGAIQEWIDEHGYVEYARRNTSLFKQIVAARATRTVYALSSGFILYEEVDPGLASNGPLLRQLGISILLLPSPSPIDSTEIVVRRLLGRRPWLDAEKEARKFVHRYERYRDRGDIRIYSKGEPETVAQEMVTQYMEYLRASEAPGNCGPPGDREQQ